MLTRPHMPYDPEEPWREYSDEDIRERERIQPKGTPTPRCETCGHDLTWFNGSYVPQQRPGDRGGVFIPAHRISGDFTCKACPEREAREERDRWTMYLESILLNCDRVLRDRDLRIAKDRRQAHPRPDGQALQNPMTTWWQRNVQAPLMARQLRRSKELIQDELKVLAREENSRAELHLVEAGKPAVPALIEALDSPDEKYVLRLMRAIQMMKADAVKAAPTLRVILDQSKPGDHLRREAVRTLWCIGAMDALERRIETLLDHSQPQSVRNEYVEWVSMITDPRSFSPLLQFCREQCNAGQCYIAPFNAMAKVAAWNSRLRRTDIEALAEVYKQRVNERILPGIILRLEIPKAYGAEC